ncbi:hypothetical protein C8N29_101358 [Agitococcus lubricus]|uniref:Uncharacterized protein n=1 Tax=Agitococcus lubricus TaxID=1077255 RepID=A0A2T5J3U5_9GAMM|nr:hypothetical protein C8N29_101358 [Agitococcus lubricus]
MQNGHYGRFCNSIAFSEKLLLAIYLAIDW